jgi:hypothetical protein
MVGVIVDADNSDYLFNICWHCHNQIPKDKVGMYNYWCSDACKKLDDEHWTKALGSVMDETTRFIEAKQ